MTLASPAIGLLPKEETLANKFLDKYPEYDGRNTIVAIFDTGVDPGACGLQITSDGRPKVIDIIDATGAGDIDTSVIVEATVVDGKKTLSLPSGKILTLNPAWPPSVDNKYHVGLVTAFHIFPRLLIDRLKKERKEQFDIQQREAVNHVQQKLMTWTSTHAATTNDPVALRVKKDLQSQLSVLEELSKSYTDVGPLYDAIVFFDGTHWRAALDVEEQGDFTNVRALTNYAIEREYSTFSFASQLNYVLNIYDEGNTLSVVCDVGAHGTHVAGIVAAYHPEQKECNGVAPGAQIISVKIGDARMGSMETTSALSRAINAMIQSRCDVINMSYGEYASEHNTGRIIELLKELVDEHGITFVCSAGNNGPALTSIGSPGGTTSHLLSVGAYVSPQMMEVEYSMRRTEMDGNMYTWSSRGPTFDGDVGVNIVAPGAAITAVPNWTLNKKQLMNGTSMSSPNCAGNIALLLSALKHQEIAYTPYSIRRALENTAQKLPHVDVYAQGSGLIQVLPALEYLLQHKNTFDGTRSFPLYYQVEAAIGNATNPRARGIFLRDAVDFEHDSMEVNVTIKPIYHRFASPQDKIQFEQHVRLVPSVRWVDVGSCLTLMQEGRTIKVLVTTKHLPPGEHAAEIVAWDSVDASRGRLFTIPIWIIKPHVLTTPLLSYKQTFVPGTMTRRFITPPSSTTWMDVILSRDSSQELESNGSGKLYMLHIVQCIPFVRPSKSQFQKAFYLRPGEQVCYSLDVSGGVTTEVCLAQFWSALGDSSVHIDLHFHGIVPNQQIIQYSGGIESYKVMVETHLQPEIIAPTLLFTKWIQRLRPSSSVITPVSVSRDKLPEERQIYQLVLTYTFTIKDSSTITPTLPLLKERLYESPFESQLSMVFDDKKRYLGASDAYGDSIILSKKGTYTILSQVRHEDVSKLEKLEHMICFLEHSLKDTNACIYTHQDDVALGRKPLSEKTLYPHKSIALFLGEPSSDQIPSTSVPGDMLVGKFSIGKKNGTIQGLGRRPTGFDVFYVIPPTATPHKEPEPEQPKDERDEETQANEAVRDLLLTRLNKLCGKPEFTSTYERLVIQYPTHVPLLKSYLEHVDHEPNRLEHLNTIIDAADRVLTQIPQDPLAHYFGTRFVLGDQPHVQKKLQKEKEVEKDMMIDALARKARALGDAEKWTEFLQVYHVLQKWTDVDTPKYLHVSLLYDQYYETWGMSIQRLLKVASLDAPDREKILSSEKLTLGIQTILNKLEWTHWNQQEKQQERTRSATTYRKF